MFGPFRPTVTCLGGYLWKTPWRMSPTQKARQRKRLRAVDDVIATVQQGLESKGLTVKLLQRLQAEVPKESEMAPKDKYTTFNKNGKNYRIGLHKVPKWTKTTIRVNPKGF
ncbi:mitochondrial ribosomal protein L31-domain-containing protein [Lipomyces japonicus]|uniref:mitochondrial 54S ribosomal protein mL60 n=1 Tax=Lipomyces japonicus TaxID=56871 RepID=UPI0034CF676E